MLQYSGHSEAINHIFLLKDNKVETAKAFIIDFIADYSLPECREHMQTMVETCLTTDNSSFSEPEERADLLLVYRHFQQLLEAVFIAGTYWTTPKDPI